MARSLCSATLSACALALAIACGLSVSAPAEAAQEQPVASIEILSLPTFHRPDDELGVRVRITNGSSITTLQDVRVVVGVYFRIQTRSDLHDRFELDAFEAPSSFPVEVPGAIPPGGSRVVELDNPLADSDVLASATENGVYPLRVSLVDQLGTTLSTASTQLLYYPVLPDPEELAMNAVVLMPVSMLPARDPSGVFRQAADGTYPLEEAISPDGWIRRLVTNVENEFDREARAVERSGRERREVERGSRLRLVIVPNARTIEEIGDMADGYARDSGGEIERLSADSDEAAMAAALLDDLGSVLSSANIQPFAAPYSFADLPTLGGIEGATARQMAEASSIYQNVLERRIPLDWVYAPGGRLDLRALEQLRLAGAGSHTVFSEDSLVQPDAPELAGCPTPELSRTCPVAVPVGTDQVTGFATDPDVQHRIQDMSRIDAGAVELQRFFAETAMIREETPSRGDRVLAISLPFDWRPTPRTSRVLIKGLARAPWLELMTADSALASAETTSSRDVAGALPPHPDVPPESFFSAIEEAGEMIESYATVGPPPDRVLRLRRNLLAALGRGWWTAEETSAALRYATDSVAEVREELDKIGLLGASETTLTSREGKIQLVAFNDTGYEVTVALEVTGSLEIDRSDLELVLPTEQQSITLDVTARTSGAFPVEVTLETLDGGLVIDEPKTITIRSTEFNRIALAITIGSLAFLILFYVVRGLRRRRHVGPEASPT